MTWLVQPTLINEPFSDPGPFIDFRFGRRALLFDLGDLSTLSPRQLLRVTHSFVPHTHMDHFAGFDRLLRVCLHRAAPLHLIGPAGFADRVERKLRSYRLNLLDARSVDFVIIAAEFNGAGFDRICEYRAREAFRRHDLAKVQQSPGLLLDEDEFRIDGAMLDQGIPCLAFALTEKLRVNVWREGLRQLELPVGPWLREAKRAVRQGAPADRQISIPDDLSMPLGVLRQGALRTQGRPFDRRRHRPASLGRSRPGPGRRHLIRRRAGGAPHRSIPAGSPKPDYRECTPHQPRRHPRSSQTRS